VPEEDSPGEYDPEEDGELFCDGYTEMFWEEFGVLGLLAFPM
jgi:hypothetical protein